LLGQKQVDNVAQNGSQWHKIAEYGAKGIKQGPMNVLVTHVNILTHQRHLKLFAP
jgi:hypothetical protein